jgi:hypothetical protein
MKKKSDAPRLLQSTDQPGEKGKFGRKTGSKTPKKEKLPVKGTDGLINFRASDDSYSYPDENW